MKFRVVFNPTTSRRIAKMARARDDDALDATQCARFLKALGDPIRIQIIRELQSGPKTVSDLALMLELELANVSHHLRVLYNAQLVTTEREGKYIYYALRRDIPNNRALPAGLFDFGCCKLDMRSR